MRSKKTSDPSLTHLPPQSIEAEESILSAILLDNGVLPDVVEVLRAEDFYKGAHQKIFSAVLDLFDRSEPVDLVTLAEALKSKGHLESIGGPSVLLHILENAPIAVNAAQYAHIVRDKACLRRLIEKSTQIVQRCFEDQGDVDDVLDFAEASIFEVSAHKVKQAFSQIGELIDSNIYKLEERQENKSLYTGIPTGFEGLDKLTSGLQKADLLILAARPSMGKTALALNIARNVAVESNVPCAIFSLEMSKEQLSMRMLCAEARIDSGRLRDGFFSREDWGRITHAASVLTTAPIYIDDSADISALTIRAKARRLKMEKNLGLIIIDYLQLMKSSVSAERRDLEISDISRSIKSLAKEIDIPIIALSQLNRKLEERSDKRPQLSDLRESGALEQDADIVAFIYRDEVYNREENNPNKGKAEIIVAKHRNGPTGMVPLVFLKAYTRFENPAPDMR
ncbi:replicative DNA helicase [Desulfatirhabdium butyrativorans]|uniref:replicative DNA helicase n=1 Tax=Desulfatirhabdium butyrativorans TaxID=340467 RepID=UPI0003FC0B12|nr:replicative DNA helicase [Desulfatirhabdium butyrativorans]